MSPNSYVSDLRAERDALRAVVARVEGLADEWGRQARSYMSFDYRDKAVEARDRVSALRTALGSTDSDPASTERQGEAEGAGDGV